MKVAVFSTKTYDETFLRKANHQGEHQFTFFSGRLEEATAPLAASHEAVCAFVNDRLSTTVIHQLADHGVKYIAMRCAGYNNVDLSAVKERGLRIVRVPAYSPHAVAEHATALLLGLNRHLHKAYNRVREGNFELAGLMGFDLHGKTVCVIGAGKIGAVFARIMLGFGCRVLVVDAYEDASLISDGATYLPLEEALPQSDVISLHCPLTPGTRHLLNRQRLPFLKPGVLIINTGRGALVDTSAMIAGLKSGQIGGLGLDVYEEEEKLFFEDHSHEVISDDVFMRLTTFPNVIITGHQAFFTQEALGEIAVTTLRNLQELHATGQCANEVTTG